jgi:NitT/TauT family transport system substrate-binding protein
MKYQKIATAMALLACSTLISPPALADDHLKLAIGQIDTLVNQVVQLGQDVGIFKKHGLILENFGSQGTGESMQAVISGSADIAFGVGTAGTMRAFANGAPVRIVLPVFTGTSDLYWYARTDSPIKSLKDTTSKTTIAYSASGSSTHNIVLGFIEELGAKGVPTATGSPPGTFTSVMSGQIDIGWSLPPFGLSEIKKGNIRVVARGSDVPSQRTQTVRVTIALKEQPDVFRRFAIAYREALDWMYSDPRAIKMYAAKVGVSEEEVKTSMEDFVPKSAMQAEEMKDLEGSVRDAIKLKFLTKPLTKEELAQLIVIPAR